MKTPRTIILLLLVLISASWGAQTTEGLQMVLPQFSNPFYDSFSRNFIGTVAAGRGYTGVANLGDISGFSLNPAANLPDSVKIIFDINFKPGISAEGYQTEANYTSPNPVGLFAVGMGLSRNISAGVVYSVPKGIKLDDYSMFTNQGASLVQRFPSYYLHQITASVGYHRGPAHLGLNLHNQLHYVDDPIFLRSYDRIRDLKYAMRIQPGILYEFSNFNLGLSATLPTKFDWDQKYEVYEMKLPLKASTGICYNSSRFALSAEAEMEQFSKVDDAFDDRYTLKAGFEKYEGWLSYRLGYIYSSEVFSGKIMLPIDEHSEDNNPAWDDVPESLIVKSNEQHFATAGLSYLHKDGAINVALLHSFSPDARQTQVNLSLSFYLSAFTRKRTLDAND